MMGNKRGSDVLENIGYASAAIVIYLAVRALAGNSFAWGWFGGSATAIVFVVTSRS